MCVHLSKKKKKKRIIEKQKEAEVKTGIILA